MKNILKKFDRIGLMVLLAAFFVTVGFKAAEKMENASTWYEVEIEGSSLDPLENQKIKSQLPSGPTGDCSDGKHICAVELEVAAGTPFPSNMREATDYPGVSIEQTRSKD
jgi:hypothetical protein